jgi:hypothetical protein
VGQPFPTAAGRYPPNQPSPGISLENRRNVIALDNHIINPIRGGLLHVFAAIISLTAANNIWGSSELRTFEILKNGPVREFIDRDIFS